MMIFQAIYMLTAVHWSLFLCALLSLQVQARNVHNKTIIGYGFRLIAIIIKASVSVFRLSIRLRQITQTLALIIIAIMPNLIQQLLNNISQMPKISAMKDDYTYTDYNACRNSTRKIPAPIGEWEFSPIIFVLLRGFFQSLFHCRQSRLRHLVSVLQRPHFKFGFFTMI